MANQSPSDSDRCHLIIEDNDDSAQRFPLLELFEAVQSNLARPVHDWVVHSAWGYGQRTAPLDRATEERDVVVPTADLIEILGDPEEWFFDVFIGTSDGRLAFGIFDSAFMFVDGACDEVEPIRGRFTEVVDGDTDIPMPKDRRASEP